MKKRCYLALLFFISTFILSAQEIPNEYLFDQFKQGKLRSKLGNTYDASFNYDLIGQRFMFVSTDSTILEIANPEEMSFVYIEGRIFEHIKGSTFYERLNIGNSILYIQRKAKPTSKGKIGAYGVTSQSTTISSISSINDVGPTLKLNIAEKYEIKHETLYYLKRKNSLKRFYSDNTLAKLFNGHKDDIKEYVKENNIDFNNIEDIKTVIEYCSQYIQ